MKLQLKDCGIWREDAWRLGPLSADLDVAGVTVIMGHNGAGKSLFLRLVHGLIAPDQGRVLWDGVGAEATRAQRGFVFQTPPVMRRSVAANVGFPLVAEGVAGNERADRVAQALAAAGLTRLAQQPAATLSGGEKQRMALARALISRPGMLLLDEPSANLDPEATRALETAVMAAAEQGTHILMSTHDLGQARRLAEKVALVKDGSLVFFDGAARFFDSGPDTQAGRFRLGYE